MEIEVGGENMVNIDDIGVVGLEWVKEGMGFEWIGEEVGREVSVDIWGEVVG